MFLLSNCVFNKAKVHESKSNAATLALVTFFKITVRDVLTTVR